MLDVRIEETLDQFNEEIVSLVDEDDFDRAIHLGHEALRLASEGRDDGDPMIAEVCFILASVYLSAGEPVPALAYLRQASEAWPRLGCDESERADFGYALAAFFHMVGESQEATAWLRETIEVCSATVGLERTKATCCHLLGRILEEEGDAGAAEPLHREGLALRKSVRGKISVQYLSSLDLLVQNFWKRGLWWNVLPLIQEARGLLVINDMMRHPYYADRLDEAGRYFLKVGNRNEAERFFQGSLEIRKRLFGKDTAYVASSLMNMAEVFTVSGRPGDALGFMLQA